MSFIGQILKNMSVIPLGSGQSSAGDFTTEDSTWTTPTTTGSPSYGPGTGPVFGGPPALTPALAPWVHIHRSSKYITEEEYKKLQQHVIELTEICQGLMDEVLALKRASRSK